MKVWLSLLLAFGFSITAYGQQSAPPSAKPADSGPTLAATMQFIQEKLSEHGQVAYAMLRSDDPGITHRTIDRITDVMADPGACTLYITGLSDGNIILAPGMTLKQGLSTNDYSTHKVNTVTIAFKQVEKVSVSKLQDYQNQTFAEAGHPEITSSLTPTVFHVKLSGSSAIVTGHVSFTQGTQAPVERDITSKIIGYTFRDEETATKIAKAMKHTMELCGGGVTKKELF